MKGILNPEFSDMSQPYIIPGAAG